MQSKLLLQTLTANPNPHLLLFHLFSIQMFIAPNTLTSLPSVLLPYSVYKSYLSATLLLAGVFNGCCLPQAFHSQITGDCNFTDNSFFLIKKWASCLFLARCLTSCLLPMACLKYCGEPVWEPPDAVDTSLWVIQPQVFQKANYSVNKQLVILEHQ